MNTQNQIPGYTTSTSMGSCIDVTRSRKQQRYIHGYSTIYSIQGDHLGTTSENQSKAANSTLPLAINPDKGRIPKMPYQDNSVRKTHSGRIAKIPARLKD